MSRRRAKKVNRLRREARETTWFYVERWNASFKRWEGWSRHRKQDRAVMAIAQWLSRPHAIGKRRIKRVSIFTCDYVEGCVS